MASHVHHFSRHIADGADGRAVYGCDPGLPWAGCGATEVRRPWEPSPYAAERAKRRNRDREKRWGNGTIEVR